MYMVTSVQRFTETTIMTLPIAPADLKRIARSFQRANLLKKYSRGTIKRSTMAMINHYIRMSTKATSHQQHSVHMAM